MDAVANGAAWYAPSAEGVPQPFDGDPADTAALCAQLQDALLGPGGAAHDPLR